MKRSWDYNFHSHTYRCGHAEGADEDYVLAAVKAGFKTLGFSDHVFLPGIHEPRMRGEVEMLDDYVHSIRVLRSRYAGLIDVYTGFEAEYCPEFESYYRDLLANKGIEYLILGQHSFFKDGKMNWYSTGNEPDEAIRRYTQDVVKAMESGLFLYCNHPDFFLIFHRYWNEACEECALAIAEASKRTGVPLEINMAHGRLELPFQRGALDYPCPEFWDIVSRVGCDVVFGVDAHRPIEYAMTRYELFEEFAKNHHLKIVTPKVAHR